MSDYADQSVTGNYTHTNYRVASTWRGVTQVITSWLTAVDGVDLFETMVFTPIGAVDRFTRRYSSEADAKAGHARVVSAVSDDDDAIVATINKRKGEQR